MGVLFVPRSTWHPGVPTSNNGSPRPRLRVPVPTITRHYTGSPPLPRASAWTAQEFMPWFQSVAVANPDPIKRKSFEYNYVIPPRADGSSQVWEYAGAYQAAHSEDENPISVGVLFAIGVTNHPSFTTYDRTRPVIWEPITPEMIDAYRWLRDVNLIGARLVLPDVAELEHFLMPGANTVCPGVQVTEHSSQLDQPYTEGGDMAIRYFKIAADQLTIWATADELNATRLDASTAEARNVDVFTVPTIPPAQAATFTYHAGLPYASVR